MAMRKGLELGVTRSPLLRSALEAVEGCSASQVLDHLISNLSSVVAVGYAASQFSAGA